MEEQRGFGRFIFIVNDSFGIDLLVIIGLLSEYSLGILMYNYWQDTQ